MEDRMHHRLGISSSLNDKNKISRQDSLFAPCVSKVSLSRRHQSLQNKSRYLSIKEIDSNNVIHVTIRPLTNNVCSIENKLIDKQKMNHTKSIPDKKYTFETTSITQHSDKYTNNVSQLGTNINWMKDKNTPYSYQRNPKNERKTNSTRKKRYPAGYCCSCQPFCAFFSVLAALLFASAIAALLIAFIEPPSTSSTLTTTTATTTSTSTSSTSTSTSTTTTVTRIFTTITRAGDSIMGLYNTSAGQSTGASNGVYPGPTQTPAQAIDGILSTKYLNFGFQGYVFAVLNQPGYGTGFYVTPSISNASVATALLFATANDYPTRDPITITLEGTNATTTAALNLGSSWTLIYSGPTGIDPITVPARSTYIPQQNFSNTLAFSSYRLLVTSQRNISDAVQYGESQILGYA